VGIDAAKGKLLLLLLAFIYEHIVGKSTIVSMIMLSSNAVLLRESFEGVLGSIRLLRSEGLHQMDVP